MIRKTRKYRPSRLNRFVGSMLFASCAIALSSCTEGGYLRNETLAFDTANELHIQPIRVCSDSGNRCAKVNLFEDITRKILAQAKLSVNFLPTNQLNASRFLKIDSSRNQNTSDYEFYELSRSGGAGAFGRHPDSTRTSGPINVWFVDEIESANNLLQYGLAWVDANGVIISDDIADFNNGKGRTDTLAHEIGHNLGLRHSSHGAGSSTNLLTSGSRRLIPDELGDIYPAGSNLSHLNNAQLKEILDSPFVTRKPGSLEGDTVASDAIAVIQAAHDGTEVEGQLVDQKTLLTALSNLPVDPSGRTGFSYQTIQAAQSSVASSRIPEPSSMIGMLAVGLTLTALRKQQTTAQKKKSVTPKED